MCRKIRQQLESNLKPNWIFYIYIYIYGFFLLRGEFKPLNKILESQAKTQLWALEMVLKGFRCDDKPIQAINKGCT